MHVFSVRLEREEPPIALLLAQFSSEHSIEGLLDQIYNAYSTERLRASGLVLRPDVRDPFTNTELQTALEGTAPEKSGFLKELAIACGNPTVHLARFADLPIFVLYNEDYEPRLSGNINPLTTASALVEAHVGHHETLQDIRAAEMRFMIDASTALLPPLENTYYQNPSHRAARSFLRVGNIQYSRLAIDAVTFWLLPSLRDCKAILVDTWSLSSVAFNVSRVLASIRGEEPVPVEMLSQYQDQSMERRAALTEILDRLTADAGTNLNDDGLNVTCIVSVTHTGSLIAVLQDQLDLSGLPINLKFVALFQLGKNDQLQALCDLSDDEDFAPLDDNDIQGRSSIRIDERIYFPLTYVDIPHAVLKPQADPFRPFIDLVRGHEIISVHRDQPADGPTRHHAIHVDMEKMIALTWFKEEFRKSISELSPPPAVVLTPKHSVAQRMGQMACAMVEEQHGTRPQLIAHTNLSLQADGPFGAIDQKIREILVTVPASSSILTLDDCFITGARMTGYQARLRQLAISAKLHYLVGLARPENPATWKDFRKKLQYRAQDDRAHHPHNTVSAVFEVCVPNWQEERCPWCQERLFYEKLQYSGGELPAKIRDRQTMLVDRDSGVHDDLFLDPGTSKIKLYSGSLFAPEDSSQAEVFAAIAAAIQQLRVHTTGDKPSLGPRRHPIATILDAEHYLDKTFTDTVIRASFLRAASWEELVYTNSTREKQRTELIGRILGAKEGDVCNLSLELILADALHKCSIADETIGSGISQAACEFLALIRTHTRKP
jgi:hypothetical protein